MDCHAEQTMIIHGLSSSGGRTPRQSCWQLVHQYSSYLLQLHSLQYCRTRYIQHPTSNIEYSLVHVPGGSGISGLLRKCILATDTNSTLCLWRRTNIPRSISLQMSGSLGTWITKPDLSWAITKELEFRPCDNGIDVLWKTYLRVLYIWSVGSRWLKSHHWLKSCGLKSQRLNNSPRQSQTQEHTLFVRHWARPQKCSRRNAYA